MYDDTNSFSNASVELRYFININWPRTNLNPNSPKFYVPSDPNLLCESQSGNPNNKHVRPGTSFIFQEI